jgi:hypothetical protein
MEPLAEGTVWNLPLANSQPGVRWFWPRGNVVDRDDVTQVFIGGALLGWFDPNDRDRGRRNVLLVTLAKEPTVHMGHLARAFGIGEEYLRRLRRLEETQGLGAVLKVATGCTKRAPNEKKRRELRALFEEGWNASDATRRQGRGKRVSRPTVSREWRRWDAERQHAGIPTAVAVVAAIDTMAEQLPLFSSVSEPTSLSITGEALEPVGTDASSSEPATPIEMTALAANEHMTVEPLAIKAASAAASEENESVAAAADEESGAVIALRSRPIAGGHLVQHLGTWLLMALAYRDGLHDVAAKLGGSRDSSRIAIDATLAALAIGQRTVEGVRRLATPSAAVLLRADHAPTASAVRRRLWQLAKDHGTALMANMSRRYLEAARADVGMPAVFYVDNHLRPYSGQEVVRKGWRMQEKRVLPGTSDYYTHDEDGRPLFRIDVPSHDSLSQVLMPIATRLREALGPDERILLAFDRAASYADDFVALRDGGFEFVAYERKPYALLAETAFNRSIQVRGETYGMHEQRLANLGRKRGRVRRISLRTPDGHQINVLGVSALPAEDLVAILVGREAIDDPSGRWVQENGFKHGVERWGINQLDGRKVELYPPGTIIANKRRRRIERALAIARADEGRGRCALAALKPTDEKKRTRVETDLADAIHRRVHLELMRPLVQKRAPVEDTELAGKLVRHTGELKAVVDTIRIVAANVEADLAEMIAPHLRRPREAKKVIANLFAAPGRVDVTTHEVRVRLATAANRSERAAIRILLAHVTAMQLTLPGDARRLRLRLELQPL